MVAQILMQLGFYMGSDLNQSNDNLWFTFFFKRPDILSIPNNEFNQLVDLFQSQMSGISINSTNTQAILKDITRKDHMEHSSDWLTLRMESLLKPASTLNKQQNWGWKEPNTHIVLPRLLQKTPTLKYIHVFRNGLDMAFSNNQNQLKNWGSLILGSTTETTPYYALKYWCKANRRAFSIGKTMGASFFALSFDELCTSPQTVVKKLIAFLNINKTSIPLLSLSDFIHPPKTIGRFKTQQLNQLDPDDIMYVKYLGFDIE